MSEVPQINAFVLSLMSDGRKAINSNNIANIQDQLTVTMDFINGIHDQGEAAVRANSEELSAVIEVRDLLVQKKNELEAEG